jgi:tRNA(fMet)-specific endonuclease VapC
MKYLLDTNICIHFFRGKFDLLSKFEEVGIDNCSISEITLAELVFGAEKSQNPQKNHKLIEDLIEQVAVLPIYSAIYKYGKEKARLSSIGTNIGDFDLLIGSTATENELIMVTENVSEFERIEGIKIENWINRK